MALRWICENGSPIDALEATGPVSVS
ncbi:hypothetical protein SPHINGO391_30001 [Sphingomonas aurantiaca]|uniref:Uncharacterized protein n=1 Tax=Sphingomonas aurantiaca TaxID=185949 RepID=A0A5E7Y081_9SPHN|nr:hypothetical protein SPHINGO391_30001 [Sphingomonas aurantiaca]